jgi:hypothetical protein
MQKSEHIKAVGYEVFLFSQLALLTVKLKESDYEPTYDEWWPVLEKHLGLYDRSTFNDSCLPEYECMVAYIKCNAGAIRSELEANLRGNIPETTPESGAPHDLDAASEKLAERNGAVAWVQHCADGRPAECPYAAGTVQSKAWHRGWNKGA